MQLHHEQLQQRKKMRILSQMGFPNLAGSSPAMGYPGPSPAVASPGTGAALALPGPGAGHSASMAAPTFGNVGASVFGQAAMNPTFGHTGFGPNVGNPAAFGHAAMTAVGHPGITGVHPAPAAVGHGGPSAAFGHGGPSAALPSCGSKSSIWTCRGSPSCKWTSRVKPRVWNGRAKPRVWNGRAKPNTSSAASSVGKRWCQCQEASISCSERTQDNLKRPQIWEVHQSL